MKKAIRAMTADEFSRLPNLEMLELVQGEAREMSPARYRHARTTNRIQVALSAFVNPRGLGEVLAEMGFLIERDPDTVRAPDCAYVQAGRIPPSFEDGFLPFAPDIAVETRSRRDRPGDALEKIHGWLAAGCRMVLAVDPDRREVKVYLPEAAPRLLKEGDVLEGGEVLPGFEMQVSDLFA